MATDDLGRRRETLRKRVLLRVLSEHGEMPLEELRVRVLAQSAPDRIAGKVTRGTQVSFARTIREHCPDVRSVKIPIVAATFVGLLARCAMYRLPAARRAMFLTGARPTILCRYDSKVDALEPRFRQRYVIPQYRAVTFRFFAAAPSPSAASIRSAPGVFIPCTSSHKLTVVTKRDGGELDLAKLANVPWMLFGYGGVKNWFELSPTDRLEVLGA